MQPNKKEVKEIRQIKPIKQIAMEPEKQPVAVAPRSLHHYEYKNNQLLSDILFAASGMGLVVLLSHSIRLISAGSKQTISQSASQQIQKANQQAREIASKLGLGQKEALKKKKGVKQSI